MAQHHKRREQRIERRISWFVILVGSIVVFVAACTSLSTPQTSLVQWSSADQDLLRSLWIDSLPPLPEDPSNAFDTNPEAAQFGQRLFFSTRFSGNGRISCANCHHQADTFTDGLPVSVGMGRMTRNAPTIAGAAYSPLLFRDGRKDSLWSQALTPLESSVEHGGTRTQYAHSIDEHYRTEYEAIFGPLPDFADRNRFPERAGPVDDPVARAAWEAMAPDDQEAVTQVYVNIGKAIAAFERPIRPGPSPFDRYVEAVLNHDTQAMQTTLTDDEIAGLQLFLAEEKTGCLTCHNGPLLTNDTFHALGVPPGEGLPPDPGFAQGIEQLHNDEFNCLSRYSDAEPEDCSALQHTAVISETHDRAFRTPTLRNVADTAPYMHAGQMATLHEVLLFYNTHDIPTQPALHLSQRELDQLEAFLRTLSGPLVVGE